MGPKNTNKKSRKKAAEERKRLLEEELRQQALKDEAERLKREAEEMEAALLLEKKERKFRVVELEDLRDLLSGITNNYRMKTKLRREKEEWERYLLCDGSPDPRVEPEINTYMNLWREDEERIEIDSVYKESKLCLRLIDEITFILDDISHEPYPEMNEERLKQSKQELIELMQLKLDRASHELLKRASALADSVTANLQVTYKSKQFSLSIWGNLSKNPRIKDFEFSEERIGFDIPKVLRLSDVAVRILFMSYDPYSSHAKSYLAKQVEVKPVVEIVEFDPETENTDAKDAQSIANEELDIDNMNPMDFMKEMEKITGELTSEEVVPAQPVEEEEKEEEIDPPPEDLVPSPEPISYMAYDGPIDGINLREYQVVGGVFIFELLVLPEQPKTVGQWTMYKSIFPSELVRFEYSPSICEEELAIRLTQENLLSEAHSEVHSTVEQNANEPTTHESANKGKSLAPPGLEVSQDKQDKERDDAPILVKLKIEPSLQILDETPKLAYWDDHIKEWRTEGVLIKCYNIAIREIIFTTRYFGVFALFQDFHINFPFQAWSIRPYGDVVILDQFSSKFSENQAQIVARQTNQSSQELLLDNTSPLIVSEDNTLSQISGDCITRTATVEDNGPKFVSVRNHCIVQILSAIHEVVLEVLDDRVRVVENPEKSELNFLSDKWFTVPQLIRTMRFYGINIFPREDSIGFVGGMESDIVTKAPNPILESRLYEQIALLSPSVAFSSCLWNREYRTKDMCYVCSAEHLTNDPVDETQWGVYEVTRKKVVKLSVGNYSKKFSRDLQPDLKFHAEFYHMFEEEGSDIGRERVTNIDHGYFHTVRDLLQSIRVMTFCK